MDLQRKQDFPKITDKINTLLPQLSEERSAALWSHPSVNWVLWSAAAAIWLFILLTRQPPGISAIALAAWAAAASFRDFKATQKFFGTIVFAAFAFLEFRSIAHDKSEQDQKHIADQVEMQKRFAAILDQNQQIFQKTRTEIAKILDKTDNIINNITGGDAYAYIDLAGITFNCSLNHIWTQCTRGYQLKLINGGKYTLHSLAIQISLNQALSYQNPSRQEFSTINLESLTPGSIKILDFVLCPKIVGLNPLEYDIRISAMNGYVDERVVWQPQNDASYKRRFVVSRMTSVADEPNTTTEQVLFDSGWSEDRPIFELRPEFDPAKDEYSSAPGPQIYTAKGLGVTPAPVWKCDPNQGSK